jgi:uncharacterized membrane protein
VSGALASVAASSRSVWDRFFVPVLAACVLSVCVLVPQTYARAAIVFPIALLLPGYVIVLAAFGPARRFDWVPTLCLAGLLSMAFYPLAGLLLAAVSIAPSTQSVVGAVDVLVAATFVVSAIRSLRAAPRHRAPWLPAEPPHNAPAHGMEARRMLVLTVAALTLAGIGLAAARALEPRPATQPYTAIYLAGPQSHQPTPVVAAAGAPLRVVVGVTNHTGRRQTYRLAPTVDGTGAWPVRTVSLPPGARWTGPLGGTAPAGHGLHELVVKFTTEPRGTAVGSLTLWVRTTSPV